MRYKQQHYVQQQQETTRLSNKDDLPPNADLKNQETVNSHHGQEDDKVSLVAPAGDPRQEGHAKARRRA
jgi:hypothetical protein